MPSPPNSFHCCFPRWNNGAHRHNQTQSDGDKNNNNNNNAALDDNPISNSVECYACTQVGVPVFHSTSCDQAHLHQPLWEASAGSSLVPISSRTDLKKGLAAASLRKRPTGLFGPVLDPRSKRVQRWNRSLLLARGLALAIDPLFFYALSIGRGGAPCLYMDGGLAAIVTVLRTCVDAVHLCHLWLQFRLAYVSRESLVVGCGKLVWDARAIASNYVRSFKGFWFDAFVILPVPQAVFWLVVPKLIREEKIKLIMTILLLIFLFQFLPKVYHSICLMKRMQKVTGYIFGTIWWGFGLNLIAYFIASHVAGGCWYVLAIQRVASCLRQHCEINQNCNLPLSCAEEVCYQFSSPSGTVGNPCGGNSTVVRKPICLDVDGTFNYGIYQWALPVISSNSLAVKILYPIFWGLMTLSTFGNDLEPTSHWLEVIFSICIVLSGLLLFTLLIGNIQVFLHAVMAKKRKMQLRCRDMEWWMKRRQLPSRLRKRVRHYERQRWAVMGGEDEMELVKDLPEGLRRDIKRFLCLDLIKKVPLFQNLDDLILDNICDRVRPLVLEMHHQRFMEITIVSARGLKKVKHLSKMDVYVVVSISNSFHTEQKTPVDKDGGTTPNWNFPMNFTINEAEAKKDHSILLILKVKCKRRLHTDKDIGEVQVPIKELYENGGDCKFVKYVTYQMKKPSSNKLKGEINLSYKFTDCVQETASFKIDNHIPILAYPAEPLVLTQSPSRSPSTPPLQSHVDMEAHPYPPAEFNKVEVDADHSGAGYEDDDDLC